MTREEARTARNAARDAHTQAHTARDEARKVAAEAREEARDAAHAVYVATCKAADEIHAFRTDRLNAAYKVVDTAYAAADAAYILSI